MLQDEKKEEGAASTEEAAAAHPEALQDVTNETAAEKEAKGKAQARPRERRERGPPADGIPSKTKVMVANLPYDLTEEKVRGSTSPLLIFSITNTHIAEGAFHSLPTPVRQDRPAPDPPLHDQEAPGSR